MAKQRVRTRKNEFSNIVKGELGGHLTLEIRHLIEVAVRKDWDVQHFTQRFVNTKYFRQKFPGLIEKNGTIANELSGQQGQGVSPGSLGQAIRNYRAGLNQFADISSTYGFNGFDKKMFASALKSQTSAEEFAARLKAIDQVDSNPALKAMYEQNLKAAGLKAGPQDLYRAAAGLGEKPFMDVYEATQFQYNLGLDQGQAKELAKEGGGSTFENVDELIANVRQNLQGYAPELKAQGLDTVKLVKVLANPSAYQAEVDIIRNVAQQRQSLYGRPVAGTYARRGAGGGLALYEPEGQASYG